MVNTTAPDAVHALQLNARKRKSPPRDEEVETSDDEVIRSRGSPSSSTFGLHDIPQGPRRKLSIDVAAAAAAAAQCYREESKASSSSPRTAPSSARPFKFLRLSVSAPPSPSSSSERQKRKLRRDQASKRRLYRLYNKRIPSTYSTPAFRLPPPNLTVNPPYPAHTLSHPIVPIISSLPYSAPSSSSSSPVTSPTIPSSSPSFTRARPPAISHTSSSSLGSGPSRTCLHQSCVAFRFASMMDGVHLSSPVPPHCPPVQGSSRTGPIYVPPILPPINRYTLQELDLEAIMKNPQLRHDLLFDVGLQFRPTDSKRKRETTEMYWCAILSELEDGCPCVSFNDTRCLRRHVCHCASGSRIPRGRLSDAKARLPYEDSLPIRVPSRIRPLIEELREVILAVVLPPSPPIPVRSGTNSQTPNPALRPRRLSASDQASVAWLHEAFDVPLVEQQLKHGVFDLGKLFVAIGDLLKKHCAPARDTMVQKMMEFASNCGPGKSGSVLEALSAIRTCFELLELMRLDLANHLLSHLRPHLLASAPQFELSLFGRRHNLDVAITRQWFAASYERVAASSELHNALGGLLPAPEQVKSLPSVHRIVATLLPALVDLVIFPPSPTSATLPPSPTTTPVTKSHQAHQPTLQPGYPETLYLDHSRLLMLTSDASDITANFMLLSLVRQFVYASPLKNGMRPQLSDGELTAIRREIAAVGPSRPGLCFCKDYSLSEGESIRSSGSSVQSWRSQMSSLVLHLAQRIENSPSNVEADSSSSEGSSSSGRFVPPSPELVDSVTKWCSTHMCSGSPVSTVFRKKLANAVLKVVIPHFFSLWNAGVQHRLGLQQNPFSITTIVSSTEGDNASKMKTGLEPLSADVRVLAERLAKLAVLHLRVYIPFYLQNSFLSV